MKKTSDFLHGFRRDKFLPKNRPNTCPGSYRDTKFANYKFNKKSVRPKKFM